MDNFKHMLAVLCISIFAFLTVIFIPVILFLTLDWYIASALAFIWIVIVVMVLACYES